MSPGYWRDYLLNFLVIVSHDPAGTEQGGMELIGWFLFQPLFYMFVFFLRKLFLCQFHDYLKLALHFFFGLALDLAEIKEP